MVALSRRAFLATGASLAGGLCLALRLPLAGAAGSTAESAFAPNAFVHVASDGTVTLTLHKSEMGQGAHSGLAAILADELDVGPGHRAPDHGRRRPRPITSPWA